MANRTLARHGGALACPATFATANASATGGYYFDAAGDCSNAEVGRVLASEPGHDAAGHGAA